MKVKLIGMGCSPKQLTADAVEAIRQADLIIGASRMLEGLPETGAKLVDSYKAHEILDILLKEQPAAGCVLFSGDSGFYSGAQAVLPLLRENGIDAEVSPEFPPFRPLPRGSACLGRIGGCAPRMGGIAIPWRKSCMGVPASS